MPKKGFKHTEESKRKIGLGSKGRIKSEEERKNISIAKTGKYYSKLSEAKKGHIVTEETKLKLSLKLKGRPNIKNSILLKGKKHSEEQRKRNSDAQKGEKGSNYRGGITPINKLIRNSLEYRLWRESVFKRDNWTCVWCGAKSGNGRAIVLNADHIKPFAYYPELRFAIDNGRTLCVECHRKTDTYARRNDNK